MRYWRTTPTPASATEVAISVLYGRGIAFALSLVHVRYLTVPR